MILFVYFEKIHTIYSRDDCSRENFQFCDSKNYIKFKQVITMAYDLKKETDVKEYLDKLGIEYRFGCYSEKKADGNKKKLNFSLLHNLS